MAKPMVWLGKLSTDGRLFISMFCFSREGNPRKYPFPPTLRTTYYIPESLVQWSIDLFEVPCWGILFFAGWGSTCADNSIYFIKPPDEWWVVNPQAAVFPFRYRKVQATLVFNKTCVADWNFLCPASRAVSCTFFKTVHRQSTVLTYRRWDWQNADILKYLLLAIWTIVQIPTRLGSSWFTFHIFLVNSSPLLGIVQPRFLTTISYNPTGNPRTGLVRPLGTGTKRSLEDHPDLKVLNVLISAAWRGRATAGGWSCIIKLGWPRRLCYINMFACCSRSLLLQFNMSVDDGFICWASLLEDCFLVGSMSGFPSNPFFYDLL